MPIATYRVSGLHRRDDAIQDVADLRRQQSERHNNGERDHAEHHRVLGHGLAGLILHLLQKLRHAFLLGSRVEHFAIDAKAHLTAPLTRDPPYLSTTTTSRRSRMGGHLPGQTITTPTPPGRTSTRSRRCR